MARYLGLRVSGIALLGLLVAGLPQLTTGQGLRSVVEPRARMFPSIGAGVTAMKRDSIGRYYILAKPASVISIYDRDGDRTGQIPNANSHGATIRYAVDFDLGSDGSLFVADRGANAIEVFAPDGSMTARVPVMAPTSVVALSGGQVAVTSLASTRLVQIIDERGKVVRSFGDPQYITEDEASSNDPASQDRIIEWGRIAGDSAGGVYFAFTSLPQPTLRKYDRFGYVAYETSLPENFFASAPTTREDRVEVGMNATQLGFSERSSEWFSVGSSGDLKFGGGLGMGLNQAFASGGGFGRGSGPAAWQTNFGGAPLNFGNSTLGGTASGQISTQGAQFHVGVGSVSGLSGGRGRRGGGADGAGTTDATADQNGGTLQFFGAGNSLAATESEQDDAGGELSYNPEDLNGGVASDVFGNEYANGDALPGPAAFNQPFSSPEAFSAWSLFNARDFRPPGARRPGGAGGPGGGSGTSSAGGSGFTGSRFAGGGSGGPDGDRFFARRRFGAGITTLTATARVNLGDLGGESTEKPQITAVGVDPETQETWAGIGDALVGFSKDGTPIGVYYLTLNGGTPLNPTAVLVEPDRFLVAADPWGIFEFDRPDRSRLVGQPAVDAPDVSAEPQVISPKQ